MTEMRSQNLSVKKCTVGYSLKYVLLGGSLESCEQFCVDEIGTFLVFFLETGTKKLEKSWNEKSLSLIIKKLYFLEYYAKFSSFLKLSYFFALFRPVFGNICWKPNFEPNYTKKSQNRLKKCRKIPKIENLAKFGILI